MALQAANITNNVSTTKKQSGKRSPEKCNNENPPKRRRHILAPYSKVSPALTPGPGSTYMVMKTPVSNRMNTGHFSAWGAEDDQILYYMQKTGDNQSVASVIVSTPWQKASESSQSHLNSRNNCAEDRKKNTISTFKVTHAKKTHTSCARRAMQNSKKNQRTMYCSNFSKRLINMPEARFPRGSDDHDEKNAGNSSDTWTCDACLMPNKNPAVKCRGCESLKYGVGLERQWIPAVDMNIDTSCNEIQTTELSADTYMVEHSSAAAPQTPDGAEQSPPCALSSDSLMADDVSPHSQMVTSDNCVNAEEKKSLDFVPLHTECTTFLPPAQGSPAAWLPLGFTGTENFEQLPEAASSPPGPTQHKVPPGSREQNKDDPKANGPFSFEASMTCISFPYVFGPPPIYTMCSSAGPLTLDVPAVTGSNMTTVIAPSLPFQIPSILLGSSNEMINYNPDYGMFASSGTFGQTGPALFNTGGTNPGIAGNPSPFLSAGMNYAVKL
ncbi:uncharacterized protein LOC116973769 [Amblyraja radiata]|uniref:uncharacterized protein LOC116973769 n=1 Tax=Amblyraja radiata TaxID=386614 RepID=UPI001401C9E3|nr:uncharacterized protein LOC116973769 [Amblyraja radiata]